MSAPDFIEDGFLDPGFVEDGFFETEDPVDRTVSATTAAVTVTGQQATVGRGDDRQVVGTTASVVVSGQAATITRVENRTVSALTASVVVSGQSATVTRGGTIIFLSRDRIYTVRGPAQAVRVA